MTWRLESASALPRGFTRVGLSRANADWPQYRRIWALHCPDSYMPTDAALEHAIYGNVITQEEPDEQQ